VRGTLESQRETGVLVLPERSDDSAEVLIIFFKFKSIVLPNSVKFHEKLLSNTFAEDVHDNW
jgi:hypothetical protein